jgi:hypothetical protein
MQNGRFLSIGFLLLVLTLNHLSLTSPISSMLFFWPARYNSDCPVGERRELALYTLNFDCRRSHPFKILFDGH